tara:strand:+ start:610 stop:804 length:195 start_codon:yes stop_codon:yes gene_type:complete
MPWREDEDLDKSGEMEEAAQELFTTGYFSWKGWSQKEKEQIEQRAEDMRDEFDAGDFPGWREAK